MARKTTIASEVAFEYLDRFPNAKSLTLARMLCRDHPELYMSVEHARSFIRRYRGSNGKAHRNGLTNRKHMKTPEKSGDPFQLPASEADDYKRVIIPEGNNRILVLSDIHLPYHDIEALQIAIDYGKKRKVNTVILNGDIMDMYQASAFVKDPRMKSIRSEIEITMQFFRYLKQQLNAKIYFKLGNHEERLERYLSVKAPELLGIEAFKLGELIEAGDFGIEMVDKKRIIMAGGLAILHGHEFGKSIFSPVNPARGLYMRAKESVLAGHNHQTSEHTEPSLHGDIVTTWSTGCLCGLTPEYMPINKWNHGFAYVETDGQSFRVHNKRIHDGVLL